ncbi:hypothetical protein T484DRAFT_1811006 [Baffinella frigidus]|nr:hypothetical protein T484DRAFT_1811006 [Cryptophyta sp. CCMP2293]
MVWVDEIGAIIPLGDLIQECLPDATPDVTPDKTTDKTGRSRDVAILEEPEHLNWYKGHPWKERFSFVVGIVHTNYLVYRLTDDCIPEPERFSLVVGIVHTNYLTYRLTDDCIPEPVSATACHKIIKLSDAVGEREQSVTANVNGVRPHFLALGKERRKQEGGGAYLGTVAANVNGVCPHFLHFLALGKEKRQQGLGFEGGAYYIGKALWTKGYRELLDACTGYKEATGRHVKLTLFGDGPDLEAIKLEAEEKGLHWT